MGRKLGHCLWRLDSENLTVTQELRPPSPETSWDILRLTDFRRLTRASPSWSLPVGTMPERQCRPCWDEQRSGRRWRSRQLCSVPNFSQRFHNMLVSRNHLVHTEASHHRAYSRCMTYTTEFCLSNLYFDLDTMVPVYSWIFLEFCAPMGQPRVWKKKWNQNRSFWMLCPERRTFSARNRGSMVATCRGNAWWSGWIQLHLKHVRRAATVQNLLQNLPTNPQKPCSEQLVCMSSFHRRRHPATFAGLQKPPLECVLQLRLCVEGSRQKAQTSQMESQKVAEWSLLKAGQDSKGLLSLLINVNMFFWNLLDVFGGWLTVWCKGHFNTISQLGRSAESKHAERATCCVYINGWRSHIGHSESW